jgi:5-methylcytosine-specific restriction endonuclease McrA
VVVYSDEHASFTQFVAGLRSADLRGFESEAVELDAVSDRIAGWEATHFPGGTGRIGGALVDDLFRLARHAAHHDGEPPTFFAFSARDHHDLDAVAARLVSADLTRTQEDQELRSEYDRTDRFWGSLYRCYGDFKHHYNVCAERELARRSNTAPLATQPAPYTTPQAIPFLEPDDELKEKVRTRDGFRCVCCDLVNTRARLHIDHITASYHGGQPAIDNLQTLCSTCNRVKGVDRINFRTNVTPLTTAPPQFQLIGIPSGPGVKTREDWQTCLRRSINFFYRCSAVARVEVGLRGEYLRTWSVELHPANDPAWLKPHYQSMLDEIRETRRAAMLEAAPDQIRVA